jgi:hypothetical protein
MSSGGIFSPRKRSSLAIFLRFWMSSRSRGGRDDVYVVVESMLKQEEVGDRDLELMLTPGSDSFILGIRGTGSDRS